jgi:hypothetical protein
MVMFVSAWMLTRAGQKPAAFRTFGRFRGAGLGLERQGLACSDMGRHFSRAPAIVPTKFSSMLSPELPVIARGRRLAIALRPDAQRGFS